ncbi:tetraspanin [Amylostereum chailletii]|nr:tetraspanin [Amylostereum chailletii]
MKHLVGIYAFFTLCVLTASVLSIVFSIVWRKKDLLLNMIFNSGDLTAGLVMGIALMITSVMSVAAIVQRNHVMGGLVALNWALIADAIIVLVVGTKIWFFSLRQRAEFHTLYAALTPANRIVFQDKFSCCGYFNATDLVEIGGKFCTSQDFANSLNQTVLANQCVTGITGETDLILNHTFTVTYGFMAPIIALFLASLCVIKVRQEIERFKSIDAKRGGRGFV